MEAYQIGRVEGLWENFLPPIQGGRFRAYIEDEEEVQNEERFELCSSWNSSRSSTPSLDGHISSIRHRRPRDVAGSLSSSSISSLSSSEFVGHEATPSYIDAW